MDRETFMDIKGYEGLYQISTLGRVWSIKSQQYLRPSVNSKGYYTIHLRTKNGKDKLEYIHRLMAITYINNPDHYTVVNHKDGDIRNNTINNLEWVEKPKENTIAVQTNRLLKGATAIQSAIKHTVDGWKLKEE